MLQTHNLTFAYTPETQFSFPDFACKDLETLLILGQSGKGKTTLLHLMALLLKPSGGSIEMNNQEISQLSVAQAAQFRAEQVGDYLPKIPFCQCPFGN